MTQEEPSDGAVRFVRYAQLRQVKGIPFSRVHIDRLEKAGRFPRRVRLEPNTVAWREDELDDWSAARSNKRAWSGTKTRARVHVTIEKGDDQLTRIRKIHEGFKKLGELTNADWVLEHARAGDFDPLLEHLRRGGDIPAEMKHFLASTIDALLQRKPVRKSKPVTAATSGRNFHIACFVLQLEDWGVPPSGAQKAASEKFCLNMRSVQDIANKGRDEARALLNITKGIFGPDYDKEWELANGLTKDDVAALAAPQSKRRSR